jgi:isoleucyl-tRNA synthetase
MCVCVCVVLLQVLLTLVRSMAPFTPMFCELLFLNLRLMLPPSDRAKSVHFLPFPQARMRSVCAAYAIGES